MTYAAIIEHLENEAKRYNDEEYARYEAEIGWEDWMDDFADTDNDDVLTESDCAKVNAILKEAWDNVHN